MSIPPPPVLAPQQIPATIDLELIKQFRPWELLPPADWADPARCSCPGPYTAYRPDALNCNQCGQPLTPAKMTRAVNRTAIVTDVGPTA